MPEPEHEHGHAHAQAEHMHMWSCGHTTHVSREHRTGHLVRAVRSARGHAVMH